LIHLEGCPYVYLRKMQEAFAQGCTGAVRAWEPSLLDVMHADGLNASLWAGAKKWWATARKQSPLEICQHAGDVGTVLVMVPKDLGSHLALLPVHAHCITNKTQRYFVIDLKRGSPPLEFFLNVVRHDKFIADKWLVKVYFRVPPTKQRLLLTEQALRGCLSDLSALDFSVEIDDKRTNKTVRFLFGAHPGMVSVRGVYRA